MRGEAGVAERLRDGLGEVGWCGVPQYGGAGGDAPSRPAGGRLEKLGQRRGEGLERAKSRRAVVLVLHELAGMGGRTAFAQMRP